MKRLLGTLVALAGLGSIAFGLLFLVGSRGETRLLVVGGVALVVGAVLAGLGIRWFRRATLESPEYIRAEILALARRRNGELSRADVAAQLGRRAHLAEAQLLALQGQGVCRAARKDGAEFYVFENLQPRLTIRRCEYCGAEVQLEHEATTCPSCGGTITTEVERLSLSDGYAMDEP
jgi:Zn finger protein HypA/HybF involved in hydrogenase expression